MRDLPGSEHPEPRKSRTRQVAAPTNSGSVQRNEGVLRYKEPMRIAEITVYSHRLPVKDGPYRMALTEVDAQFGCALQQGREVGVVGRHGARGLGGSKMC